MKNYIIAHDLGTTGNKATLYDQNGLLRGSVSFEYDTNFPDTGWAEQNPADWWMAICDTTRRLLQETGVMGSEVACVTFSGQMMGCVALDKNAQPLRSAIIWMDQRAREQVARVEAKVSNADVYRITGHRASAAYSLYKILWIKDHQPEIFASTHKFVCAKDAMVARLTGKFVTEPSDASGMNCYDLVGGTWSSVILDAAELDVNLLPDVVAASDVVGGILPQIAEEIGLPAGTPVVVGGGDGACAAVGAGSVSENIAYSYVGSSSWIATSSAQPIYDPEYRTFTFGHVVPGLFMPTGTMQTAGASYQWARDQLAPLEKQSAAALGVSPYRLMNAVAETSPPGSNSLVFLPYLAGERAPRWNPDARAVFLGLTMRHTRADMIRSVLEGVALNLCVILDAFRAQGAEIDGIRAIGGGVSGRLWSTIMADIYGVPLHRLKILEEATSMGAAVIGGVGVGLYPDFSFATEMNAVVDTIKPDFANRTVYDNAYRVFEEAYTALEPVYKTIASLEK